MENSDSKPESGSSRPSCSRVSDTPETDEMVYWATCSGITQLDAVGWQERFGSLARHARRLERGRNTLARLCERAKSICLDDADLPEVDDWITDYAAVFSENDQEEPRP